MWILAAAKSLGPATAFARRVLAASWVHGQYVFVPKSAEVRTAVT